MRQHRFVLDSTLVTPLHAGSGRAASHTDAEIRFRADGRPIIPGTSIAGALRTVVERLANVETCCLLYMPKPWPTPRRKRPCGCAVCELFGDVNPVETEVGPKARASRVIVLDAPMEDGYRQRVVDEVAIERERRSAAPRRLFDHEELLPGAKVKIEIRGENLAPTELGWLGEAMSLLGVRELPLGGRTARGLGRLEVVGATLRFRDLRNPAHLAAAVTNPGDHNEAWPVLVAERLGEFPRAVDGLRGRVTATFVLRVAHHSTLLIADPMEAARSGFDRAPRGGPATAELPGTSLRGALRSGAERILRSLGHTACDPTTKRCQDLENLCLACRLFGNEDWASQLSFAVVPMADHGQAAPFDHVAIDRFTGGARDRLKFDALASRGRRFRVQLMLDPRPPNATEESRWMVGLLALSLRDLADGRITVGHGAARGHGWLEIEDGTLDWSAHDPDVCDLDVCVDALWKRLGLPRPRRRSRP